MLKIPALIDQVKTTKDGGLTLKVDTNELTAEEKAQVMSYHMNFGYFMFHGEHESVANEDLSFEKLEFPNQKSQSQRLRNVIYRLWEQNHGGYDDFELYYKNKTEKIIEWLKEKLD